MGELMSVRSDFPKLDDTILRILTLDTFSLNWAVVTFRNTFAGIVAFGYFGRMMVCFVLDCRVDTYLPSHILFGLSTILQSRHICYKSYLVWIKYDSDHVLAWYCRCRAGARTVGTCLHIAAIIWYLGQSRLLLDTYGVKDWGKYLEDAAEVPETVDSSDSEVITSRIFKT